jgi:hypothetical protein
MIRITDGSSTFLSNGSKGRIKGSFGVKLNRFLIPQYTSNPDLKLFET